MTKQTKYLDNN